MTTTTAAKTTTCPRCDGKGRIPEYGFIADGVCFRCSGSGVVAAKPAKVNKYSQIKCMHCETPAEAREFRLAEIERRFPGVLATLDPYAVKMLGGGGRIKSWIGGGA